MVDAQQEITSIDEKGNVIVVEIALTNTFAEIPDISQLVKMIGNKALNIKTWQIMRPPIDSNTYFSVQMRVLDRKNNTIYQEQDHTGFYTGDTNMQLRDNDAKIQFAISTADTVIINFEYEWVNNPLAFSEALDEKVKNLDEINQIGFVKTAGLEFHQVGDRVKVS